MRKENYFLTNQGFDLLVGVDVLAKGRVYFTAAQLRTDVSRCPGKKYNRKFQDLAALEMYWEVSKGSMRKQGFGGI